jgi:UDP-N-acetylmuramate dehydrogenase
MTTKYQITPRKNFSLTNFHTFKINSIAKYYIDISTIEQLQQALKFANKKHLKVIVLGAGSNSIFCGYINAVVITINIKGKKIISSDNQHSIVESNAGENWHNFVQWTLINGCYGLENLSLIPGTVGASPVQNIGAYGVELSSYLISLQAIAINSGTIHEFSAQDCKFNYRDSIFKNVLSGKYIIISVQFKLNRIFAPKLAYQDLKNYICYKPDSTDIQKAIHVSQAICNIRCSKLPDPNLLYNAGSFFKNPIISDKKNDELKLKYNKIPIYQLQDNWKVSAGWLIESVGMKGYRYNNVGVYCKHALVLVNYGKSTGVEILALLDQITNKVKQQFDITLEVEPNLYIGENLTM